MGFDRRSQQALAHAGTLFSANTGPKVDGSGVIFIALANGLYAGSVAAKTTAFAGVTDVFGMVIRR
ncbi:hypothetical protein LP415_14015 [Polaromonas sp. P1(28)-8]|nr:hypothetical protein LP415_14015 [Polaromonas sp. P1(28)-8]